jgi:hypothetical protein
MCLKCIMRAEISMNEFRKHDIHAHAEISMNDPRKHDYVHTHGISQVGIFAQSYARKVSCFFV